MQRKTPEKRTHIQLGCKIRHLIQVTAGTPFVVGSVGRGVELGCTNPRGRHLKRAEVSNLQRGWAFREANAPAVRQAEAAMQESAKVRPPYAI